MTRKLMGSWAVRPAGMVLGALLLAGGISAARAAAPQTAGTNAPANSSTAAPRANSISQIVRQAVQQAVQQTAAAQQIQTQARPASQQLTPEQMEQALEIAREAIRPGGPATLGILVSILVPLGFFTMLVLIAFFISRRRSAQTRAQAEIRKQLIDKFGTAQELAAFLESKGGQQFFQELQQPLGIGGPLRFLPAGIIISMLGLAFLGLMAIHRPFIIPGVILLAIGVGLLLSAAIGHKLMPGRNGDAVGPGSGPGMASLPRP